MIVKLLAFLRPRAGRRNPLRRSLIHSGGIMALVFLLIASGAGVTYALWNASAKATSTAKGAQLAVTAVFGGGLSDFKFQNHVTTTNGTLTVKNTTVTSRTTAMPVSTQLSAGITGADVSFASKFAVWVWPQTAAACTSTTLPASGKQGTWATIPAIETTLAPSASVVYCVRVVSAERSQLGATGGTFTITPMATATLAFNGTSTWAATAAPTVTQATQAIYPVASISTTSWYRIGDPSNTTCIDVEASTDANGTVLLGYGCKPNTESGKANQRWKLTADGAYYRISTQLSSGRDAVVTGGSVAAGAGLSLNSTSSDAGRWQLQQISAGAYQLVNQNSGLCLTRGAAGTSNGNAIIQLQQSVCAGSAAQTFSFVADGSTIVQGPAVVPGPTTVPNPNARYEIKALGSTSCVAAAGTTSPSNITTTTCGDQTVWRFTETTGGAYFVSMANPWGNSAGLRMHGANGSVNLRTASSTDAQRFTLVSVDGAYRLRNVSTATCLTTTFGLANCNSANVQKFTVTMIGNPNPAIADLTCTPGNWTATYSWPVPADYQSEVKYRAYIGTTIIGSSLNGWQTFQVDGSNGASLAAGESYEVTVEQQVGSNTWTTVGTSVLTKVVTDGSTNPYQCGAL